MTIFSVDVETSGLNPILNDVTSISIIEIETEKHFTCAIDDTTIVWDEETFEWAKNNIPLSVNLFDKYDPESACSRIVTFLRQFNTPYTFMAWPASFDYPFVQKLFSKTPFPMPFHYRTLDLHSMLVGRFGGDVSKGRSDNDGIVPTGIIVEPTPDTIHNPYYDALAQLKTYKNLTDKVPYGTTNQV